MVVKVTIDTVVYGKPLGKFPELCTVFDRLVQKVDPVTFEPINELTPIYSFNGKNYIAFGQAVLDKNGIYSAMALRLGDRIKKDGTAPVHKLYWKIKETDDFLSKIAYDWKNPIDVTEKINFVKVQSPAKSK